MTEKITFIWHDTKGEALPSPTTRKKIDDWKQIVADPECPGRAGSAIYFLDFLSDVIAELQEDYNSIILLMRESNPP
jgi:hypothetical protein|tara:strand:+ start:162 stop:392 length:231 start_codon:yes stop_codon:yes gene_type:complete